MPPKNKNIRYSKYIIVEFEDGIQTVPVNWLTDNINSMQCHYPVHINKLHIYSKMVENMVPVNLQWPVWDIKEIIGSSNDYKRAIEKEADCIKYNLSQVDTDFESVAKFQRKDRAKKKISSDEEIEEMSTNKRPRLDKLVKIHKMTSKFPLPTEPKCFTQPILNQSDQKNVMEKKISSKEDYDKLHINKIPSKLEISKSAPIPSPTKSINLFSDVEDNYIETPIKKIKKSVPYSPIQSINDLSDDDPGTPIADKQFNVIEALKILIKSNIQIQQTLKKIENDQKEMLSLVRNSDKVMENIMDGLEIKDIFPLKDLESLEKVETVNLKDPQFKNKLAHRLKNFKGQEDKLFIKSCLENLFTDELCNQLSFSGRRASTTIPKKKALSHTNLYKLICDVGRLKFHDFNDSRAEIAASSWLRHATDRIKRMVVVRSKAQSLAASIRNL